MLNKLLQFIGSHQMVSPGDKVICAVSGGADSIALLWGMYLLKDKLQISLEAAHFNHGLRGEESIRDEQFVVDFCDRYDIKLYLGRGDVVRGKKGLEAAARQARYEFLKQLPGIIVTAHTADDNAETVLMHMLRGTGLKGLGGITPVGDGVIRPMLGITRNDVLAFLEEYHLSYVTDSTNESDDFLRNRMRHHVIPSLIRENPQFVRSVSDMAQRLRLDEAELSAQADAAFTNDIVKIRAMNPAVRNRVLAKLLAQFGVLEPAAEHVDLLQNVVFSDNPSATADFPGNVKIGRVYDRLEIIRETDAFCAELPIPGVVELEELNIRIVAAMQSEREDAYQFIPQGRVFVRSRQSGDKLTLSGGTKSLKKLFIDRKIPQSARNAMPVICDDGGVVGVWGIGLNTKRLNNGNDSVCVWIENI